MKSFGNFHNDVATVLQNYFHYCSLEMSCVELARTFLFLADRGIAPHLETPVIAHSVAAGQRLMMTSGMYQNAGEFAWRVGLPAKSGVGGGIVAIVPQEMAIAVWSRSSMTPGTRWPGSLYWKNSLKSWGRSVF
jgi:glutaminase